MLSARSVDCCSRCDGRRAARAAAALRATFGSLPCGISTRGPCKLLIKREKPAKNLGVLFRWKGITATSRKTSGLGNKINVITGKAVREIAAYWKTSPLLKQINNPLSCSLSAEPLHQNMRNATPYMYYKHAFEYCDFF